MEKMLPLFREGHRSRNDAGGMRGDFRAAVIIHFKRTRLHVIHCVGQIQPVEHGIRDDGIKRS